MTVRAYRAFQAVLFAALGLFLLLRVWDGKILWYINQRFVVLIFGAGLFLVILAQIVLTERQDGFTAAHTSGGENETAEVQSSRRAGLLWLALPVVIGFLLPAQPLGAAALATRGINTGAPLSINLSVTQSALQMNSTERSILDWIRLFTDAENSTTFDGQAVDVTGFVFHDPRLGENEFMVGRFSITCCVADAYAIGMAVHPIAGSAAFTDSSWVRVRGTLRTTQIDGNPALLIEATQIEAVAQPEQPYLFP